jgi:hypothetical protein
MVDYGAPGRRQADEGFVPTAEEADFTTAH